MRRLLPGLGICIAIAAGLAGCGDEDERTRTATVSGGALTVKADEYSFDPGALVVTGGARELRITLDNRGELAHNLRVLQDDREIGGTPIFPAGESRTATVRVEPGTLTYVCTVADHEDLGMTGEIEVRE